MRKKFVNCILKAISKNQKISKHKKLIYKYNLECFYTFFTKFIIIFLINLVLKINDFFILLAMFFTPLRRFSFGFHAGSNLGCWIMSLIMYSIIPWLIKSINFNHYFILISSILLSVLIIVFAPAGTKERPLNNKKKNQKRKIIVFFILVIYIILVLFTNTYNKIIFLSLAYQAFLVNPITYKIFYRERGRRTNENC